MTTPKFSTPVAAIELPLPLERVPALLEEIRAAHEGKLYLHQYESFIVVYTEGAICHCGECNIKLRRITNQRFPFPVEVATKCDYCGYNQCPHGTAHMFKCTNSNVPGQAPELDDAFADEFKQRLVRG